MWTERWTHSIDKIGQKVCFLLFLPLFKCNYCGLIASTLTGNPLILLEFTRGQMPSSTGVCSEGSGFDLQAPSAFQFECCSHGREKLKNLDWNIWSIWCLFWQISIETYWFVYKKQTNKQIDWINTAENDSARSTSTSKVSNFKAEFLLNGLICLGPYV